MGALEIDSFDGRPLRNGYSLGPDFSFFYLTRAGFFLDKSLALEVLTNPGIRVIGQDTVADMRRYQVSFFTTYEDALTSFFRGIIGQDWGCYAPRENGSHLVYPDLGNHLDRNMNGAIVEPAVGFSLQLYAMIYGMTLTPRSFDQSFIDKARLFVKGGAEGVDVDLPENVKMVEFLDEDTGLTYMAPSYPDAFGNETGVAAQMLLYAQQLKDAHWYTTLELWMDNLNILRQLTWKYGFGGESFVVEE
jgi:hypothetical protein